MNEKTRCVQRGWWTAVLAAVVLISPAGAFGQDDPEDAPIDNGAHCSSTARVVFIACGDAAEADAQIAVGKCKNIEDFKARGECLAEARSSLEESLQLCREQLRARKGVCRALGEGRYDPDVAPALFDEDPGHPTNPNLYFPLAVGNRWEFGGAETIVIKVLDKRKLIAGVNCIVVNDKVKVDGEVVEDTQDWFAQAKNGDVYYFGEETKEYETFAGDVPKEPELVGIGGSFKAGREGDKPGIGFLASPQPGMVYRQEFSLDNAEDVARIRSTTYSYGEDADLDRFVPQELAEMLCNGDCIVVDEFSPIEPGALGRKYHAAGIGFFLEIDPNSGDVVQLVGCNFDPRCNTLPEPE
jgi:hypothetical protein